MTHIIIYILSAMSMVLGPGEEHQTVTVNVSTDAHQDTKIIMVKDGSESNMTVIHDGKPLEIDLNDLAEGDSITYTLDDGTPLEISNQGDSYALVLDGEDVLIRDHLHQSTGSAFFVHADDDGNHNAPVMIQGIEGLDDTLAATIREALQEAGIDQDIVFEEGRILRHEIHSDHGFWVDDKGARTVIIRKGDQGKIIEVNVDTDVVTETRDDD